MKPCIKHLLIRVGIVLCIFLYLMYESSNLSSPDNGIGLGLLGLYIYGILFVLFIIETIYLLFTKSMKKFYVNLAFILIPILFLFIDTY